MSLKRVLCLVEFLIYAISNVFLGRALEKQNALDEAANSYKAATKIKPNDELAWKGLCNLYEAQGSRAVAKHTEASLKLAQIYADQFVQPQRAPLFHTDFS